MLSRYRFAFITLLALIIGGGLISSCGYQCAGQLAMIGNEMKCKKKPKPKVCHKDCSYSGHCGGTSGNCIAVSDADCLKSTSCKVFGKCGKVGKVCRPEKKSHCTQSEQCKKNGKCHFQSVPAVLYNQCVKP